MLVSKKPFGAWASFRQAPGGSVNVAALAGTALTLVQGLGAWFIAAKVVRTPVQVFRCSLLLPAPRAVASTGAGWRWWSACHPRQPPASPLRWAEPASVLQLCPAPRCCLLLHQGACGELLRNAEGASSNFHSGSEGRFGSATTGKCTCKITPSGSAQVFFISSARHCLSFLFPLPSLVSFQ